MRLRKGAFYASFVKSGIVVRPYSYQGLAIAYP